MKVNFKEYVIILDQKFRVLVPSEMRSIELHKCDNQEEYEWSGNYKGFEYLKYTLYILGNSGRYRNTIIYFPFKEKGEKELVFSNYIGILKKHRWSMIRYFMKHMQPSYYSWRSIDWFWVEKLERDKEYWDTLRNLDRNELVEMKKESTLFHFITPEEAVLQYLALRKGEGNEFIVECNSR